MKILIACEESQAVCKAFRACGHEAYSCDILPCSGGHPEWHFKTDVLRLIYDLTNDLSLNEFELENGDTVQVPGWDMIIAHPPCTYLSNVSAPCMFPKGIRNEARYHKMIEARDFFMKLLNAPCDKICVENPRPLTIAELPKHTQEIQPYMFGAPFRKATRLWLKGLPPLLPTRIATGEIINWVCAGSKGRPEHATKAKHRDSKTRSKTFPEIAKAMAEQWEGV